MTNLNDVLVWSKFKNWRPKIQSIIDDVITRPVINAVKENPPEYCFYEDLDWLHKAFEIAGMHVQTSVVDLLADRLPTAYSHIRVYHACRPTKIEDFYKNGFTPAIPNSLNELAEKYFLGQPGITKDILSQAIKVAEDGRRGGSVFFTLDDRNLISFCPHYLIYGSEYLAVIAHELQRLTGKNFPELLKTIGIPTIFVCDLPIENTMALRHELSGKLFESLFEGYVRPQNELTLLDLTQYRITCYDGLGERLAQRCSSLESC